MASELRCEYSYRGVHYMIKATTDDYGHKLWWGVVSPAGEGRILGPYGGPNDAVRACLRYIDRVSV